MFQSILFDDKFDMNILTKETYKSRIDYVKDNLERVNNTIHADDMLYSIVKELS